jgi:hypothetical protein
MRILPSTTQPRTWQVFRDTRATNEEYELLLAFVRAWHIPMRIGRGHPDLALELGPMSESQELAFAREFAARLPFVPR